MTHDMSETLIVGLTLICGAVLAFAGHDRAAEMFVVGGLALWRGHSHSKPGV